MNVHHQVHAACEAISRLSNGFVPTLALVLGSGLGALAETIESPIHIPYEQIPGFPHASVQGHAGKLTLGYLSGLPVACLQGRAHPYESGNTDAIKIYVRTLKKLGARYFLATNAAGSFREEVPPGSLVLVTDHINMQGMNPLVGPNDDSFGPRFPPLDQAYTPALQDRLTTSAKALSIPLHTGVYLAVMGPCYETAAEIRAFKLLGADLVGMSTVPEVLVATHCGMQCAVISTVTNYVTGLSTVSHDHQEVVAVANRAAVQLTALITDFAKQLVESND